LLRQIVRAMAKAAGVIAVVAVQSDSTASAAATDKYSTMFAEMRRNPHNAEALHVTVTARDFDIAGEETQASDVGIFETYIGFIDLAVIARNGMAQVMDAD